MCPVEVVSGDDPRVKADGIEMDPCVSKLWVIDKYIWSGTGDIVGMLEWMEEGSIAEWAGPIPIPAESPNVRVSESAGEKPTA